MMSNVITKNGEARMPGDMAGQLEYAANCIGDASRADLQVMLRRAALMIRNAAPIGLDAETEDVLLSIAGELGITRNDMIRHIVKEWLETNAYLPLSADVAAASSASLSQTAMPASTIIGAAPARTAIPSPATRSRRVFLLASRTVLFPPRRLRKLFAPMPRR